AWVCFDYDQIEAKLVACYSDDEEDLDCFNNNLDIHSMTAVGMLGWEIKEKRYGYIKNLSHVQEDILRLSLVDETGKVLLAAMSKETWGTQRLRSISEEWANRVRTPRNNGSRTWIGACGSPQEWQYPRQPDRESKNNDESRALSFACAAWVLCGGPPPGWQGKDDKTRGLAKVRYCLLYGKDHKAAEDSAYAAEWVKQGGNREELVEAARLFLRSKPGLVACKKKWWDIVAKNCEARTEFGRRRRLYGVWWDRAKEGWNHMIQGWVSDALNLAILDILKDERFHFIYPSHDAVKIAVPGYCLEGHHRDITIGKFKEIVERTWEVNKHKFVSTAGWFIRWPSGEKEAI
ncbi:hypothetical protein LCGC14_2345960, partial [marine sediment metagenome]